MTKTTSPKEIGNIRLLLLVVIAGLLLALHFYHPPQRGLWTQIFFNSLHVPVFGLIAVCLYAGTPKRYSSLTRAIIAMALTGFLGALSEVAQVFTSRDASLHDLVADASGAAGFLFVILAVSHSGPGSSKRRGLYFLSGVLILGWSLFPLGKVTAGYLKRNNIVPVLVQFDSPLLHQFVRRQNLELEILHMPPGQGRMAAVTFGSGRWPGVAFHDLWPDWRGYSTLIIKISFDEATPLELNIRVHDRDHNNEHTDRYNNTFTLQPGVQELGISLNTIEKAPRDRLMDMSQIAEIILFGRASDAGRTFRIQEIRLE